MTPAERDELTRHHPAAFGWALACCAWDRSAAEDVLHTAYLKIIDGRAAFGGRSDFRTFLFGVIRRTAQEERRYRAIRSMLPLRDSGSAPAIDDRGLDAIVHDEESRELIEALARLPRRQREVLHLVFYSDLTIAAAADVLGISVGSARVHYQRGKDRLRERLSRSHRDG